MFDKPSRGPMPGLHLVRFPFASIERRPRSVASADAKIFDGGLGFEVAEPRLRRPMVKPIASETMIRAGPPHPSSGQASPVGALRMARHKLIVIEHIASGQAWRTRWGLHETETAS
jgi:hypothetical protein